MVFATPRVLCGLLLCTTAAALISSNATASKSNILFILTDDQDITLGSLTVMPKLQKLVTDKGTLTALDWYLRFVLQYVCAFQYVHINMH